MSHGIHLLARRPPVARALTAFALAACIAVPLRVETACAQPLLDTLPAVATWTWTGGAPGPTSAIAVSPNGKLVLSGHQQVAIVWDPTRGRAVNVLRGHKSEVIGAAFLPGSGRAVTADKTTIIVWDVAAGRQVATWAAGQTDVNAMAVSPDGRRLATGGRDNMVRMWDVATRKPRWTLGEKTDIGSIGSLAFSPDGKLVADGSRAYVTLRNAATGQQVERFHNGGADVWSVAFAPDGRTVASAQSGVIRIWDVAGKLQRPSIAPPAGAQGPYFQHLAYRPDGRHLLVVDVSLEGHVLGGAATIGEFVAMSPEPAGNSRRVAVSPDGARAYVGQHDGTIVVLDLAALR